MKGVRKGCLPLGSHYNVIVTKFPISGSSTTSSFVLKGVAHCIRVSVIIKKLSNQLLCYWHLIKPKQLYFNITLKSEPNSLDEMSCDKPTFDKCDSP